MGWVQYENGNYKVALNLVDGTKIRFTDDDFFEANRPESMDIKITNKCSRNCPFCHENSSPNGHIADMSFVSKVIKTLPPYCEVAVGGGNLMDNPLHTETFLRMLVEQKCVPSITVRQEDFLEQCDRIKQWYDAHLVYGIGVSLSNSKSKFLKKELAKFPTSVVHVINGLFTEKDFEYLRDNNIKILILGYKDIRRGSEYMSANTTEIAANMKWLAENLTKVFAAFSTVSFDNLALEQLPVREAVGEEMWERSFMGDDGSATFYIDLVKKEFAESSSSLIRYPIVKSDDGISSIQEMFEIVKTKHQEGTTS